MSAVSDPGEARARLEDAMALVCTLGQPPHHEDRVFVSSLLTAALALPYDLIALLVESGALVPAGYSHARPSGMAPYVVHWEPVEGTSNAPVYRRTEGGKP